MKYEKFFKLIGFILVLILALIVVNVPWLINVSYYYDLDPFTYIRMLDSGAYATSLKFDFFNFFNYISNEWGWRKIAVALETIGFQSEFIFFTIIPMFIYVLNFYILLEKKILNYFWLLLHPLLLMFYLNQLRLALAIAIFSVFFILIKNKKIFYICVFPLSLIHTSIIIFIIIFIIIDLILNRIYRKSFQVFFLILLGIAVVYVTGPMIGQILTLIGDRRADIYSSNDWNSSFLSSVYWLLILLFFILSTYRLKKISFEIAIAIVFLSLIVVSPFFEGGYPYRFLTAVFIIIIIAIAQLPIVSRYSILILLMMSFIYQGIYLLYWI